MSHPLVNDAKAKMDKTLEAFQAELGNIRTSRVTPGMLDIVDVEVYGSHMKINQLGMIHVVDSHLLAIDLWDKSTMASVEKAILASPLGVNPSNDGKSIKVPFPMLTEQRRKDLCKMAGKHAEEAKVSVRNVRRVAVEEIKKQQKDGKIPEDDEKHGEKELQKLTDDYIGKIDGHLAHKEKEIMTV